MDDETVRDLLQTRGKLSHLAEVLGLPAPGDDYPALLARLDALQAMERRVEECTTWCGQDGMHRAVRYIRTGEV